MYLTTSQSTQSSRLRSSSLWQIRFMKRFFVVLVLACACFISKAQSEPCTFVEAKPVWSEGRAHEKNLFLSFREVVEVSRIEEATIRLTASCDYRLSVNGKFVGHGPCVAAHDFYRIDAYDLKPHLRRGKNVIAIEVAGYNVPSYYLLAQPSFLQAEVELNGKIVAATGKEFEAYALGQRLSEVPKFSFQRTSTEEYDLTASRTTASSIPPCASIYQIVSPRSMAYSIS